MADKDTPAARRRFLAAELRDIGADCAIISHPKHIFYLTGFPTNLNMWFSLMKGPRSTSFLAVDSEGRGGFLVGESDMTNPWTGLRLDSIEPLELGVRKYTDYSLSGEMVTYGNRLALETKAWLATLDCKFSRVAIEEWHLAELYRTTLLALHPEARLIGISEFLLGMRNSKGKDEVQYLEKAVNILDYAYEIAKKNAKIGKLELDVYAEMNAGTFRKYGPFCWVVGDHVSGERSLAMGGLPTRRKMRSGETIILDLQASCNNYWADLCRTFTIGRRPTKAQRRNLSILQKAKMAAEEVLMPGTMGKEVYETVSDVLVKSGCSGLPHHAGHGIGLDDQEPPWFIPAEERRLEEGSVCVVEPGVYRKDIGGMRIEDQYVITKRGPRKLSTFPLALS